MIARKQGLGWRQRSKLGSLLVLALLSVIAPHRASAGSFVYVTNTQGGTVSVIDSATNTVKTTISIGGDLLGIAISPDGKSAYVGGRQGTVSVIDTDTNAVTASISDGSEPRAIVFTPNGAFAYVTDQGLNVVSVIDTATKTVVGPPIPVGNTPAAVAITPDGAFVFVVNNCGDGPCFSSAGTVSIIDTSSNLVIDTVPIGYFPDGIAITPNGGFVYVANQCADSSCSGGSVSVINTDTQTVTQTIPIIGQFDSQFVTIAPDNKLGYVANTCGNAPPPCPSSGGAVSVIDLKTNSVVGSPISVGAFPGELGVTPDGTLLYVVNQGQTTSGANGSVSVIATETNEVITTITVGVHPAFLAIIAPTPTPTPTPTATPTPVQVTLKIEPASLKFPETTVGTSSKPKSVKVSNPKGNRKHLGLPVVIEMISGNSGVFTETHTCPPTLERGAVCSVTVTFTPSEAAMQFGTLVITDNANRSPQTVPLRGKGK